METEGALDEAVQSVLLRGDRRESLAAGRARFVEQYVCRLDGRSAERVAGVVARTIGASSGAGKPAQGGPSVGG